MSRELEGRTISSVEKMGDCEGLRMYFTDGTYAELEGYGYESAEVGVELFTPEKHRRRALKVMGDRERRRVQRLAWSTQATSKAEMRGLLGIVYGDAQAADLYLSPRLR